MGSTSMQLARGERYFLRLCITLVKAKPYDAVQAPRETPVVAVAASSPLVRRARPTRRIK